MCSRKQMADCPTLRDHPKLLAAVEKGDVPEIERLIAYNELVVLGAEDKSDGKTLNGHYESRDSFYQHSDTDATIAFEDGLWKLRFQDDVYSCSGEGSKVPVGLWPRSTLSDSPSHGASAEVKVIECNRAVRKAAHEQDVKFLHAIASLVPRLFKDMLEFGMDMNCVDGRGISPLMRVAGNGCEETSRHLLSTIMFCVTTAFDTRVVGQWRSDGMSEGRRKCCRVHDPDVKLRWVGDLGEWQMGMGDMSDSNILYRNINDQESVPLTGWRAPSWPAPSFEIPNSKGVARLSTVHHRDHHAPKSNDATVVFEAIGCSNERVSGEWRRNGDHHGQPQFAHFHDDSVQIKYMFDQTAERDGERHKVQVREWQLSVDGVVVYHHPTHGAAPGEFMPFSGWHPKNSPPRMSRIRVDDADLISGRTPLIVAAMGGHDEVVKVIIEALVDVNISDNSGCTALMWAAVGGGRPTEHSKLKREKPEAKAKRETAEKKQEAVVRHLMHAKAKVDIEGSNGRWLGRKALDIAGEFSTPTIARLIQGYDS